MSADESTPTVDESSTRLGVAVGTRMRFPGPSTGRHRTLPVGALASSSVRFAASTRRSAELRRALAAGGAAGAAAVRPAAPVDGSPAPPRWWSPTAVGVVGSRRSPADPAAGLPPRGLPRAVRKVPNQETWTPGGIAGSLVSSEVRVRRHAEVAAVGGIGPDTKLNVAAARVAAHAAARTAADTAARTAADTAARTAADTAARTGAGAGAAPHVAVPQPAPAATSGSTTSPGAPALARSSTAEATNPDRPGRHHVPSPPRAESSSPPPTAPQAPSTPTPSATSPSATSPSATPSAVSAVTAPVRRSLVDPVEVARPSSPSVSWRATPRSARFAAAVGRRSPARPDSAAGTAVALVEPASATDPSKRAMIEEGAAPRATPLRRVIGSALPSSAIDVIGAPAPHAARIAPLRRMVGYAHSVRPALRAGAAAPRVPSTGLLPSALDREAGDAVTSRTARSRGPAPSRIARTETHTDAPAAPAGPDRTAVHERTTSAATLAADTATGAPTEPRSSAASPASPASRPSPSSPFSPSSAASPAQRPSPSSPASRPSPPPHASVQAETVSSSGTVLPLRRHLAVSPQPTDGRALSGPAADPDRTAVEQRAVTTQPRGTAAEHRAAAAAVAVEPRGVALSSVRSLRASRTPVTELRPSTSAGRLAPAPSAYAAGLSARPGLSIRTGRSSTRYDAAAPAGAVRSGAAATAPLRRSATSATSAFSAATERLTAIAMPDQFTTQRPTRHGAGGGALGSGFGAPEPIRPSTVAGASAAIPTAAGRAADVINTQVANTQVANTQVAAAQVAAAHGNSSPARTGARRGTAPSAALPTISSAPAGDLVLARSYVMAPPRVSMRPAGPPVPASAARAAAALPAPVLAAGTAAASDRSAVYASAAALFRSMSPSTPGTANLPPGTDVEAGPMSDRVIRRSVEVAELQVNSDVDTHHAALQRSLSTSTGRQLDELAELVVERIEQRVIDELERRGRRGVPGAF